MSEDERDQIIGNLLRQHRESQHRVGYCRAKAATIQRIIPAILGAIADQQPLPTPRQKKSLLSAVTTKKQEHSSTPPKRNLPTAAIRNPK